MRGGASASAADEIAQEVMVIIWRKAASFDRRRSSVNTWVFTIARNKRIDRFRRERRPEYDPDDPLLVTASGADGDHSVAASQRAAQVQEALSGLPREQAIILEAAYFGGQSLRVIADDLGVPLGTVKSRIRLAMKRLRGVLNPELL
jgi:RNA polymerase sigma-70 factor (ECF subfamily)